MLTRVLGNTHEYSNKTGVFLILCRERERGSKEQTLCLHKGKGWNSADIENSASVCAPRNPKYARMAKLTEAVNLPLYLQSVGHLN